MSKTLKYKNLIASQCTRVVCPKGDALARVTNSFRWCTDPVDNPINYLPNIVEDQMRKRPPRRLKGDEDMCGLCAISFFDCLDEARARFAKIPPPSRQKLGYTHISNGIIEANDGLSTPIIKNHFMLFEYEGIELSNKFQLAGTL